VVYGVWCSLIGFPMRPQVPVRSPDNILKQLVWLSFTPHNYKMEHWVAGWPVSSDDIHVPKPNWWFGWKPAFRWSKAPSSKKFQIWFGYIFLITLNRCHIWTVHCFIDVSSCYYCWQLLLCHGCYYQSPFSWRSNIKK